MRRAILILGLLLGACGGDDAIGGGEPVEPLPAADRVEPQYCETLDPAEVLDAVEVHADFAACDDLDRAAFDRDVTCESGQALVATLGDCSREVFDRLNDGAWDWNPIAANISSDIVCEVLHVIDTGEGSADEINDRADATIEAVCG